MPPPVSPEAAAFGTAVRARRHLLELTQEQLAERSALHWTFVGQVERGQRNISLSNMTKLAKGLGVALSDLVANIR